MQHALTFHEAVALHQEAGGLGDDADKIAWIIAGEYEMTCGYIEERIGFLARHAGSKFPRTRRVGK